MSRGAYFFIFITLTLIVIFVYIGKLEDPMIPQLTCGEVSEKLKLRKRMVGGSDVAVGTWPWHVSILYRPNSTAPFKHHCGGAIVHKEWVVSAAACFYQEEHRILSNLIVKAGTVNLQVDGSETQVSELTKIILHKYFNPVSLQNDIALLQLSAPLEFNSAVHHVCIPDECTSEHTFEVCYISGYDQLGILQQAWVEYIPNLKCNKRTWWNFRVTKDMICASRYGGGTDGCKINIGGPLNCFLGLHQRFYITGVRVVGDLCGVPRRPNIYLTTKNYFLWIEDYLVAGVPHNPTVLFTLTVSLFSTNILTCT